MKEEYKLSIRKPIESDFSKYLRFTSCNRCNDSFTYKRLTLREIRVLKEGWKGTKFE